MLWVKTQAFCSVTPPLSGTILLGIMRASIIELATREGIAVDELPYSFEAWQADATSGHVKETFACGTAAVVTAIGEVRASSESATVAKAP